MKTSNVTPLLHLRMQSHSPRGFSLIETLIVLTIMAAIASVIGIVASTAMTRASIKEAQIELSTLDNAIKHYQVYNKNLPSSLDALVQDNIISKTPKDPWNQPYHYQTIALAELPYTLFSSGPDKTAGTPDDILINTDGVKP